MNGLCRLVWSCVVSVTGPTSSSLDGSAEEPAIGRGPLCEVTLAELARTRFRGLAEPAAWLRPEEVTLADLAREYFRGVAEPAARLGPDEVTLADLARTRFRGLAEPAA